MSKKAFWIASITGTAIVLTSIFTFIMIKNGKKETQIEHHQGYIFDKTCPITAKDIQIYKDPNGFDAEKAAEYFKDQPANSYTLLYFNFLNDKFKDSRSADDLLKSAQAYLYSIMPPDKAEKLFNIYKAFTRCQMELYEKTKSWGTPSTPEQTIDYLYKIQQYRRELLGTAEADALFGPSVKLKEYPIRRGMVVEDKALYGDEKEKKIENLKQDMWGGDSAVIDKDMDPLDRYNEKLRIYQRDMAEMKSDEDRKAMVQKFRDEIFTPEQSRRMDDVDRMLSDEKEKEKTYFAQEKDIRNDTSLDDREKSQRIHDLQDRIFGTESDAFRRRLTVERK